MSQMENTVTANADATPMLVYETRFGTVELREDRLISFPKGILGMPQCTVFGLSRLPNVDESPLLLLQCINEPQVSFLVADPTVLGLEIKDDDRKIALKELSFPQKDSQFLVILNLYSHGESGYLTANLRAPLIIDSMAREGRQHILVNKDYTVQHKI